jgi:phospholipid transport system substrate-binding protein
MKMRNLTGIIIMVIGLVWSPSAKAMDDQSKKEVVAFVENVAKDVIAIIDSTSPQEAKRHQLEGIFVRYVDVDWIARFVTGQHWRKLSEEEQNVYVELYQKYIVRSYVSKFAKYIKHDYKIKNVEERANGYYIVAIDLLGQQESLSFTYRLKRTPNGFQIRDLISEGVSILSTQRSEFTRIIDQEGFEALLSILKNKVDSVSKLQHGVLNPVG